MANNGAQQGTTGALIFLITSSQESSVVEIFTSHGGFLTHAISHHRENKSYQNIVMKLKKTFNPQIVRAKENLSLSHDGPCQRHASRTNPRMKALRQGCHWI